MLRLILFLSLSNCSSLSLYSSCFRRSSSSLCCSINSLALFLFSSSIRSLMLSSRSLFCFWIYSVSSALILAYRKFLISSSFSGYCLSTMISGCLPNSYSPALLALWSSTIWLYYGYNLSTAFFWKSCALLLCIAYPTVLVGIVNNTSLSFLFMPMSDISMTALVPGALYSGWWTIFFLSSGFSSRGLLSCFKF